jgi:hypothetical protein
MKQNTRLILLTLMSACLLASCKKEHTTQPPSNTGGYQYVLEDSSVVTIPGNAVQFAQQHFNSDAQLLREYQIAINPQYVNPAWEQNLGLSIWKSESWQVRQQYMVFPYERDVRTDDSAQFYYQIGEFFAQFGYGWNDTFDPATFNSDSTYTVNIWPTDHGETVGFDGQSNYHTQYMGMWVGP